MTQFLTRGGIATLAQVSISRVEYILKTRSIAPAFRAGGTRVYDPIQVEQILKELQSTASRPASCRSGDSRPRQPIERHLPDSP